MNNFNHRLMMPQDMELSEFVSKTIIDIAKGLETAAEVLSDSDIIINPATQDGLAVSLRYTADDKKRYRPAQQIDFDVSVVASNKDVTSGGLRISVMGIGGGVNSESGTGQSHVSRLRFSIPVCFPLYEGNSKD